MVPRANEDILGTNEEIGLGVFSFGRIEGDLMVFPGHLLFIISHQERSGSGNFDVFIMPTTLGSFISSWIAILWS